MQHRNIPYEYREWTYEGTKCSAFTCKYFNFHPYHIMSFSTELEQDMIAQIDELLDNRVQYEYKRKLSNAGASAYYASKSTHDNYTGD